MALTTTEVAEFARRTRELMNDGGSHWAKGSYVTGVSGSERYCLIGALRKSLFGEAVGVPIDESDHRFKEVVAALDKAIYERFPDRQGDHGFAVDRVINFNDHGETVWADVEAVLRRAEAILDAS